MDRLGSFPFLVYKQSITQLHLKHVLSFELLRSAKRTPTDEWRMLCEGFYFRYIYL